MQPRGMLRYEDMVLYYVIPAYLTAVFVAAYWVVQFLLVIFDVLNFFWDWWDAKRAVYPLMAYSEFFILGGFVYYIVKWELTGAP